jgi:hypothetical protein
MDANGQLYASAASSQGKRAPGTHWRDDDDDDGGGDDYDDINNNNNNDDDVWGGVRLSLSVLRPEIGRFCQCP